VAVVSSERRPHAEMWCCEGGEVDGLYLVEDASAVQQADDEARNEAAVGVTNEADLREIVSSVLQLL
jgi:hypothetical protein